MGNDQIDKKYFAVLVRYWDSKVHHVATQFLAMPVCNIATAEKLFDALDTVMEEHEIHGTMWWVLPQMLWLVYIILC